MLNISIFFQFLQALNALPFTQVLAPIESVIGYEFFQYFDPLTPFIGHWTLATIVAEIPAVDDEMTNQKSITVEQYVDGIVNRVENLCFTDKKAIIKRVITKIVATKQEIKIWGRIPLLATPESGTINNHENLLFANHLSNDRKVGLNAEHWYSWSA